MISNLKNKFEIRSVQGNVFEFQQSIKNVFCNLFENYEIEDRIDKIGIKLSWNIGCQKNACSKLHVYFFRFSKQWQYN